jgi:hypothetical protein
MLNCDEPHSKLAFDFNLWRCIWEAEKDEEAEAQAQVAKDVAAGGEVHSFGMNGTMNGRVLGLPKWISESEQPPRRFWAISDESSRVFGSFCVWVISLIRRPELWV